MKVRLLRDARILHKAGEIVEVSPSEYIFLTSTKSAEPLTEKKTKPEEPVEEKKPEVKEKKPKKK